VVLKFRRKGTEVEVIGLNEASATLVDRFGVHDKPDANKVLACVDQSPLGRHVADYAAWAAAATGRAAGVPARHRPPPGDRLG
jgi:hypothetical protein